jgi:hypothetical protein
MLRRASLAQWPGGPVARWHCSQSGRNAGSTEHAHLPLPLLLALGAGFNRNVTFIVTR